ncbi:MAG TPA: flagellar biosynthesis anti-sigma factor FlgM [Allosphingosinicella sp.]|nr:flagellar biosynthesis anti-sigma factor FlgM [Allosphingosinicella sp.]
MIDGVGKGGAGRIDLSRQEKSAAVDTPRSHGPRAAEGPVKSAVRELVSGGAPVDTKKVESLRAAIQSGQYRVDADRIAQRMLDIDFPRRG